MITIATITKVGGAVIAMAGIATLWNGYVENENEEVLNNYQQGQVLARTIGNHNRDKIETDIKINDITITTYETAIDDLAPGQTMSTSERRKYSEALEKKVIWVQALTVAQEYLDMTLTNIIQ